MELSNDIKDKIEEQVRILTENKTYRAEEVVRAPLPSTTSAELSNEEIEARLLSAVDDPYFKQLNLPLWFLRKHPQHYNGHIPLERLVDLDTYNREYNSLGSQEERKSYCQTRARRLLTTYYHQHGKLPTNIEEM